MKGNLDIPKWMTILILLQNKSMCLSDISYNTKITYAHVSNVISELDNTGLINTRKEGRSKFIILNKRGKEAAKASEVLSKVQR